MTNVPVKHGAGYHTLVLLLPPIILVILLPVFLLAMFFFTGERAPTNTLKPSRVARSGMLHGRQQIGRIHVRSSSPTRRTSRSASTERVHKPKKPESPLASKSDERPELILAQNREVTSWQKVNRERVWQGLRSGTWNEKDEWFRQNMLQYYGGRTQHQAVPPFPYSPTSEASTVHPALRSPMSQEEIDSYKFQSPETPPPPPPVKHLPLTPEEEVLSNTPGQLTGVQSSSFAQGHDGGWTVFPAQSGRIDL